MVSPEPKRARLSLAEGGGRREQVPEEKDHGAPEASSEEARASKENDGPGQNETRDEDERSKVENQETASDQRDHDDTRENERYIYVEKDEGDTFMGFGKYEAMTFRQVYTSDPGYYEWAKRVDSPSSQLRRFVDWVDACKDDDDGKTLLTVGKHKGQSYSYIANHFPGYVDWIRALNTPCKELKDFLEWTKTQNVLSSCRK